MKKTPLIYWIISVFIVPGIQGCQDEPVIPRDIITKDTITVFIQDTTGIDSALNSALSSMIVTINNRQFEPYVDFAKREILIEVDDTTKLLGADLSFNIDDYFLRTAEIGGWPHFDLTKPILLAFEDFEEISRTYFLISVYSKNLLINPDGLSNEEPWDFCSNCGLETVNDISTFYNVGNSGEPAEIRQVFPTLDTFDDGYILLIGYLFSDSVINESITGHPYLWAHQNGTLSGTDAVMQGMSHKAQSNEWEVVFGIHKLHSETETITFQMSQARGSGYPYFGSKNQFQKLEARVFTSPNAASIFVEQLYQRNF